MPPMVCPHVLSVQYSCSYKFHISLGKCRPWCLHMDDIWFRAPVEIGAMLYFNSQICYVQVSAFLFDTSQIVYNSIAG